MNAPRARRSPLGALFLTVFIDLLGFGLTIPLLPFFAVRFGQAGTGATALNAVYSLMQFVFVPIWGELSDRIGRRPVLLLSIGATVVTMPLLGYADSYPMLLAVRMLQGIATANIATAQAYIADVTPPEQRARSMGMIGAAFGLGFILGPVAGGILGHVSPHLPGLVAGGLAAVNFALAYRNLPETRTAEERAARERHPIGTVLRRQLTLAPLRDVAHIPDVPAIVGAFFLSTLAFTSLESTFALFLCNRYDFGELGTGMLLGYVGIVMAFMQGGVVGRVVRAFGERTVARAGLVLLALGLAGMALFHRSPELGPPTASCTASLAPGLIIARALPLLGVLTLVGVGNACTGPSLTAMNSIRVSRAHQGSALGVQQSLGSLARTVGALLSGIAFDRLGGSVTLLLGACGVVLAFGATMRIGATAPAAQH